MAKPRRYPVHPRQAYRITPHGKNPPSPAQVETAHAIPQTTEQPATPHENKLITPMQKMIMGVLFSSASTFVGMGAWLAYFTQRNWNQSLGMMVICAGIAGIFTFFQYVKKWTATATTGLPSKRRERPLTTKVDRYWSSTYDMVRIVPDTTTTLECLTYFQNQGYTSDADKAEIFEACKAVAEFRKGEWA